jgi:hypothetical protein
MQEWAPFCPFGRVLCLYLFRDDDFTKNLCENRGKWCLSCQRISVGDPGKNRLQNDMNDHFPITSIIHCSSTLYNGIVFAYSCQNVLSEWSVCKNSVMIPSTIHLLMTEACCAYQTLLVVM